MFYKGFPCKFYKGFPYKKIYKGFPYKMNREKIEGNSFGGPINLPPIHSHPITHTPTPTHTNIPRFKI